MIMQNYKLLILALFTAFCFSCKAQQVEELYLYNKIYETIKEEHVRDQGGDLNIFKVTNPTLSVFIPNNGKTNRAAVIICPGGGYHALCIQREGYRVAEAFNKQGIVAFVLKYRLPNRDIITKEDAAFAPLKDAQRAIQMVRENATKWGVNPDKVGIMGFSAGGHLASTAGVHSDTLLVDKKQGTNVRPDFMILMYPVISFSDNVGHIGSRDNLIGKGAQQKSIDYFSSDLQVTKDTPPSILFHAGDDSLVPIENSLLFYDALKKLNIPAEMHIYSRGEHGFGSNPPFDEWFGRCIYLMKTENFYQP